MKGKQKSIWKSSKMGFNEFSNGFSLFDPTTTTMTARNAAAQPQHHPQRLQQQQQQQQQQLEEHNNIRISSASSLTDGSACTLTHQYHYIQYPAYYQLMQQRRADNAPTFEQSPPNTCRCACSCGKTTEGATLPPSASGGGANGGRHAQQSSSDDSQMAVAVTVHRPVGDLVTSAAHPQQPMSMRSKSEQSLLHHSYQALQCASDEEKKLHLAETTSCDCDLECTCSVQAKPQKRGKQNAGAGASSTAAAACNVSALMLGVDDITVSESDNNSMTLKRKHRDALDGSNNKKIHKWCTHQDNLTATVLGVDGCSRKPPDASYNTSQIDIYSDGEGDGTDPCLKINNGVFSEDDQRPPLPPRPPPRPRNVRVNMTASHRGGGAAAAGGLKKYVVWCLVCGGVSCLLGILFLGVYFLLHSYTITVGNFETVPTFVPATLLILTGLCIISLARRKNRYSYLIKLSGVCGLISALTCALVTVTTTVLHMSRLQALRECEYAQKTRTCTCYSDVIESQVERVDKEGVRLVFDSLSDCGVVHGSLYSCLRAIFGLSVAGVLIAVFSCMLVYQLLSHERKKMYWEQLELRCRSLYTSQQGPPPAPPNMAALTTGRANGCRCCEQCHAHRSVPLQPSAYPWDDGGGEPRFWTGQPPGNFYSPNPGGDDLHNNAASIPRGHGLTGARNRATGWSWPRMPWQRNSPVSAARFRPTPSRPGSQYGFSNDAAPIVATEAVLSNQQQDAFNDVTGNNLPYGVWGPPPPYSDPNSPARRGYYQFVHQNNGANLNAQSDHQSIASSVEPHLPRLDCHNAAVAAHRAAYDMEPCSAETTSAGAYCAQATSVRNLSKRQACHALKAASSKVDYENTLSDSDGGARDHLSNTLPTRKLKKRVEAGAKSIGPNSHSTQRVNVQQVFASAHNSSDSNADCNSATHDKEACSRSGAQAQQAPIQRHKSGVENSAFQQSIDCGANAQRAHTHASCDATESEVYFADVSSCCNVSVKNDNYYDDASQSHCGALRLTKQCSIRCNRSAQQSQQHISNNTNNNNSGNDEDYLAQRFGQRENSIRSRLPFPQTCNDDYDAATTNAAAADVQPIDVTHIHNVNNISKNSLPKDASRQSMCSVESEARTEFTDLSPATPCSNNSFVITQSETVASAAETTTATSATPTNDHATLTSTLLATTTTAATNNFVATFPYSSEAQSLEAHRRSTRHLSNEQQQQQQQQPQQNQQQVLMLPNEVHYDVIDEEPSSNFHLATNLRSAKEVKFNQTRPKTLRTLLVPASTKHQLSKAQKQYATDVDWTAEGENCASDGQQL